MPLSKGALPFCLGGPGGALGTWTIKPSILGSRCEETAETV
jgi:hypothetical protein